MKFLDSLKSLINRSGASTANSDIGLGVDIGAAFLKIVEIKRVGGIMELSTYGEIALGPHEEKALGDMTVLDIEKIKLALMTIFTDARVSAKHATIAISANESLIFTLKLPQMSRDDFQSIVVNEARKYVPVPITEVSLDWWRVPDIIQKEGDRSDTEDDVLVVAIKNEIINKYNTAFSGGIRDVNIANVEVETFSALRGVMNNELAPFILLDFGARSVRIAIVEYGIVKTFHIVNRGSHFITESLATTFGLGFEDAENMKRNLDIHEESKESEHVLTNLQYVKTQLSKTIINYEREYKSAVNKIILVGGGSLLGGFPEYLEKEFNIKVELAKPFTKISTPEFLQETLEQTGPEFAVALGASLRTFE